MAFNFSETIQVGNLGFDEGAQKFAGRNFGALAVKYLKLKSSADIDLHTNEDETKLYLVTKGGGKLQISNTLHEPLVEALNSAPDNRESQLDAVAQFLNDKIMRTVPLTVNQRNDKGEWEPVLDENGNEKTQLFMVIGASGPITKSMITEVVDKEEKTKSLLGDN